MPGVPVLPEEPECSNTPKGVCVCADVGAASDAVPLPAVLVVIAADDGRSINIQENRRWSRHRRR